MSTTRLRRNDPEKERYWRTVVQGQQPSGQSVREYCRQAGVKESAFYWWRRELARRGSGRKVAPQRTSRVSPPSGAASGRKPAAGRRGGKRSPFLPIHVGADRTAAVSAAPVAAVEIHLGDGRMVRVTPSVDRQTLREVLAALEGRSC